ncbi:sigma-70 family RNA polymerase sigma factor [Streptomyces radicis]|uniref:Sigma-70 family RNA polymerase sigma factor n=2 Tax=Streptomyces radicis TaxID=1750517 RepID=A0A3A9WIR0_9ACTN|nr:sigma-70 family RNA polymerase sigma factor [Streptomyces radicis]RKN27880.1 sigma-70 family RNA polymerase sigma factor [Streptomyces radicis]
MREEAPEATAWAVLRLAIAQRLKAEGRRPALPETAAFRRVVLEVFRDRFAVLESGLGLYAAIARLPERQYDVIVLQYVLGHTPRQVADIMGIALPTVRSHRKVARLKLANDLGVSFDADHDDKED